MNGTFTDAKVRQCKALQKMERHVIKAHKGRSSEACPACMKYRDEVLRANKYAEIVTEQKPPTQEDLDKAFHAIAAEFSVSLVSRVKRWVLGAICWLLRKPCLFKGHEFDPFGSDYKVVEDGTIKVTKRCWRCRRRFPVFTGPVTPQMPGLADETAFCAKCKDFVRLDGRLADRCERCDSFIPRTAPRRLRRAS